MPQDNELAVSKEKSVWRKLVIAGKLAVTYLVFNYIYNTFASENSGISEVAHTIATAAKGQNYWLLAFTILLLPVNWALESLKWHGLAKRAVNISFWEAFRTTLSGLAIGVAVPAQLGDTVGRVASLKSDNRFLALGAAILSSGIQFYVSIIGGAIGWFHLKNGIPLPHNSKLAISILLIFVLTLGIFVAWQRRKLISLKPQNEKFSQLFSYIEVMAHYDTQELLRAFILAGLRYIVFLTQFVLMLSIFGLPLPFQTLTYCVSIIFLAKTLIPALNVIGDLGLREFTALFVFQTYNLSPEKIIAGTLSVWVINVLGPILAGLFLIWKHRWKALFFNKQFQ